MSPLRASRSTSEPLYSFYRLSFTAVRPEYYDMPRLTFPHIAILLATLLLLTASGSSQTLDSYDLVFGSDSALGDITAPWPATDSLLMPSYPPGEPGVNPIVVHLMLLIGEDSTVWQWDVNAQPPKTGIQQELERVIPQWRFIPARGRAKNITVWMPLSFQFFDPDGLRVPCRRYLQVEKQPTPYVLYRVHVGRPLLPSIVLCRD